MRKVVCFFALILLSECMCAQQDILDFKRQVEPLEPSSAGIAKYGTYPVNYSSGLPSIEIPIYTIKSGDIEIPIKLTYHGGGIKLSDNASWVGLGWSLFYGGEITREINGYPDEPNQAWAVPDADAVRRELEQNNWIGNSYFRNLASEANGYSFMRDIFHFTINEQSGSYVYDNSGNMVQIPFGDLAFNDNSGRITIVAPSGNSYEFFNGDADETSVYPIHSGIPTFKSTWHINNSTFASSN